MKFQPFKRIPVLIAFGVISLVCLARCLHLDFDRLERMSFDMRAREALRSSPNVAPNLGFVYINEESVTRVWNRSLGYSFGLVWPRQVYGRVISELSAQGAQAIALDILFGELRPDHAPVNTGDGTTSVESDDFFAWQMQRARNTILAVTPEVSPPILFRTNAVALGDILVEKDTDGVLRRTRAFRSYRKWHPAFQQMADDPDFGIDLHEARVEPRRIILPRHGADDITVPLDPEGDFALADFGGDKLPAGLPPTAKPFTEERLWDMGIVLAARQLHLDLNTAEVDLEHGRITLHGPGGLQRVIPVDANGYFFIDWCLTEEDPRLTKQAIHELLAQSRQRVAGQTNGLVNGWRGKLAVIGSAAVVGNNLTDRGATPLRADTLLVSKHWNVANSILTNRFVRRSSLAVDLAAIIFLGILAAVWSWRLGALLASIMVLLTLTAYVLLAVLLYVHSRYWIQMVLPMFGALLLTHICLVTWRVVFEQADKRRVKSIFSTMVSPKIVHELLQAKTLSLRGVRREVTVLFADVRGFTQLTDLSQERVADFVRSNQLSGPAAEACFDAQARETFDTINLYLGRVADIILEHDGLLDKFIGDCVMAFWGAPASNANHALAGVLAAIDVQRSVYELNLQREAENKRREAENRVRISSGLEPEPLLPILFLGTGINSGMATVGLMGSGAKNIVRQGNYTVFGREVNLASRLENASGSGRIFIGEATFDLLRQADAVLAATCLKLPGQKLKGISSAVTVYEVPWRPPDAPQVVEESSAKARPASAFQGLAEHETGSPRGL